MIRGTVLGAALALILAPAAARGDDGLSCKFEGGAVHLQWNFAFFAPIRGYVLARDGVKIASLPATATEATDSPPPGVHVYSLSAVNLDGSAMDLAKCEVFVPVTDPPPPGLRCAVDGRNVHLDWSGAILIDVVIRAFTVSRNGELLATLPGSQRTFDDQVPTVGEYLYEVRAVVGLDPAGNDTGFAVGSCKVVVDCYGLTATVDALKVSLDWGPVPVPLDPANGGPIRIDPRSTVLRDGQLIAVVEGSVHTYVDTVPAAGETYLYEVWFDLGTGGVPARQIAACNVAVPGDRLPPPQDLTCVDQGGLKCLPCGPHNVLLRWKLPPLASPLDAYDAIEVKRDGIVLAKLDGQAVEFLDFDTPLGIHVYHVAGRRGDLQSRAAECKVEIPGGPLPAPQDLVCSVVVGPIVLDPATGKPADGIPESDVLPPFPFTFVLLEWKDPVDYDKILIQRNGMLIASLEGGSTAYRDHVVGGGSFAYEVIGVRADRRSDAATCKVEVPPGDLPPPQDLACFADIPVPGDGNAAGDPAEPGLVVALTWWNPVRYDSLTVSRDGVEIATLPGDSMSYRDAGVAEGKHVYAVVGIAGDRKSPAATCEVEAGQPVPPVTGLICGVEEKANPDTVDLAWTNGAAYQGIAIFRNKEPVTTLAGDATSYRDAGLKPGVYLYQVAGIIGNRMSSPAACQAVIPGPPAGNLLYFSNSLLKAPPPRGDVTVPPSNRIACLATNDGEVQGWSFGVQSDPRLVVPARWDLKDTVTEKLHGGQGPDFIEVKLVPGGITMAVAIDTGSDATRFETLPPGQGQALLQIEYEAGPGAAPGGVYPVEYSDALGDPPVQVLFVVGGFEVRPRTLPGWVGLPGVKFLRGDANNDGKLDISDPMKILSWLFIVGDPDRPPCLEAADSNATGSINIADAIYLFTFLFGGGKAPPAPYPDCGAAPAPLGCDHAAGCP